MRLKEKFGGIVTVLSMGPPQAQEALREAISVGVDEGVLLSDREFAGSDTLATSYALAKGIEKMGLFDIILCGKQASDGDTAQVGPGLSTHLDVPQVTYVKKIEEVKDGKVKVERMVEEGYEIIEVPLPCVMTVVKEINEPRLPSLKGKMKAKKAEIKVWTAKELDLDHAKIGLNGSPTKVVKIFTPPPRAGGMIFKGDVPQVVNELVGLLKSDL